MKSHKRVTFNLNLNSTYCYLKIEDNNILSWQQIVIDEIRFHTKLELMLKAKLDHLHTHENYSHCQGATSCRRVSHFTAGCKTPPHMKEVSCVYAVVQ